MPKFEREIVVWAQGKGWSSGGNGNTQGQGTGVGAAQRGQQQAKPNSIPPRVSPTQQPVSNITKPSPQFSPIGGPGAFQIPAPRTPSPYVYKQPEIGNEGAKWETYFRTDKQRGYSDAAAQSNRLRVANAVEALYRDSDDEGLGVLLTQLHIPQH